MKTTFLATLALASLSAHAQNVNKCVADGRTVYQAEPCVGGVPVVVAPKATPKLKARPPTERERAQCDAIMRVRLKDYDSAKFDGEPEVLGVLPLGDSKDTEGLAVNYRINAKNSYGGYVGLKIMTCYLALDGSGAIEFR